MSTVELVRLVGNQPRYHDCSKYQGKYDVYVVLVAKIPFICTVQYIHNKITLHNMVLSTEYTECWPCPLFDILLEKYFLLASLVHCSGQCTPSSISTGTSNPLQLAQTEVVLGQLSTDLASWV
jgi:hypothetical protein